MIDATRFIRTKPPRAVSLPVSLALTAAWIYLRVVVFGDFLFPLTYVLPMLVCAWSGDRVVLWGMVALFATVHTVTQPWLVDPLVSPGGRVQWATYLATLINISVAAVVVHAIIVLRERLERSLEEVHTLVDELHAQGEELASQNEELASQSEELAQQNETLSAQSEELATRNERLLLKRHKIQLLNEELARRSTMQQTLLEATRLSGNEHDALQRICDATMMLFGDPVSTVIIYDREDDQLVIRAAAGRDVVIGAVPPDRSARAFVRLALEQGRTAALDDVALRPDLSVFGTDATPPVRAVLCAPMLINGKPHAAVALYSNRPHQWTEEQFQLADWLAHQAGRVLQTLQLQDHLRGQAEALRDTDRRKNEFLATLSHELRNPLAPIRYAVQLLDQPPQAGQPTPREVIERQVRHLTRLVDDLLDATRISSNKIQLRKSRVDLAPLVRDAVGGLKAAMAAANQTADVSLPAAPVWLDADPDRLTQVLTNLLNNATHYTPPGGRIGVSVRVDAGHVAVTVTDTGVGLDPADLSRVFDMFTQVGGPGTGGLGIGLALVKGVVELHDGTVEARSEGIGFGSQFIVRLPVAASPADLAADRGPSPPPHAPRRRVLVVDDNVDAAEMMAMLLTMHGHAVRVACDGHQAVAAAADFRPDVALLDIGLPGLSGYEVARHLRSDPNTSGAHLIAVTGWGQEADQRLARESGFDAHLTKPADPDDIVRLVAEAPCAPGNVQPA